MKNIFITFCLFTFFSMSIHAQESDVAKSPEMDMVILKHGSKFIGEILKIDEEILVIRIRGGHELSFPRSEVRRIVQFDSANHLRLRKSYEFKEKGIYASFNLGTNRSGIGFDSKVGASMSMSIGHQFNRWIGIGAGLGLDNYNFTESSSLYPVFAELRGYLSKKNVTPYYNIAGGYGFAFENREVGIVEAKGGFYLNPNVGIRFGGSNNSNVTMDFGLKFQKASFTQTRGGTRNSLELYKQDLTYQRFTFRIGLLL